MTSIAVFFGRRIRRIFASITLTNVPSEPTISRAMLRGFPLRRVAPADRGHELVEVVARDPRASAPGTSHWMSSAYASRMRATSR